MARPHNGNGSNGDAAAAAPRGTLELARSVRGKHEATNLANCLLGLLLLTPEREIARLPEIPLSHLKGWGISARTLGARRRGARRPRTLRQLIRGLRAAAGQA